MEHKIEWNYGNGVLVLPAAVLTADATPEQLKVLLWLASDPALAEKTAQLSRLAGCRVAETEEAIAFWREQGIFGTESGAEVPAVTSAGVKRKKSSAKAAKTANPAESAPTAPEKPGIGADSASGKKVLRRADEFPSYTATEIADMIEERDSLRVLADESQKLFGKMFNPHELNILFGMVDYLGLDDEYILLLLAHCRRIDVKSMRNVERYAISLIDRGVTTAAMLEERVQEIESTHELEKRVRSMFGLKSRELISKERDMLENWVRFGYGEDIIRKAYEITVNNTGNASLPYANSILERWNAEGLRTIADIEQKLAESAGTKAFTPTLGNSFDADDFFQAAVRKSMEEMSKVNGTPNT